MILAKFIFGPFDQEILTLPTEEPWPRFVIPDRQKKITVVHFYLLSGKLEDVEYPMWSYLYDCDLDSLMLT